MKPRQMIYQWKHFKCNTDFFLCIMIKQGMETWGETNNLESYNTFPIEKR